MLSTNACASVSPNNKTDSHDITEIMLKVALSTINKTKQMHLHQPVININSPSVANGYDISSPEINKSSHDKNRVLVIGLISENLAIGSGKNIVIH